MAKVTRLPPGSDPRPFFGGKGVLLPSGLKFGKPLPAPCPESSSTNAKPKIPGSSSTA